MDDLGTASLHLGEVPRMRETPLCNRTPMLDGDGTMSDAKTWVEERRAAMDEATEALTPDGYEPDFLGLPRALEALDKVLELHVKETGGTPTGDVADVCSCGVSYWPCQTVQAIEGAIND